MAENKGVRSRSVEYAIQRELAFKEKIANFFADDECPPDVLPFEVKRWKALISKKKRSADGTADCSPPTASKCAKGSQEMLKLLDSDGSFCSSKGTIFRSNSNVTRRKALISKNQTTSTYSKVPQGALELLESDGPSNTRGVIFKSNSSVNADCPCPDPSNKQPFPCPSSAQSPTTSHSVMPLPDASTPLQTPNAVLPPNHFSSTTTSAPRPSLSSTFTYSGRKKYAESSNSGGLPPQQQYYCKICRVHCSGTLCFEQHLRGRMHKLKLGDSSVEERNKQVRCDLCKIFCQDESLLKMHLEGQKHKAKLLELDRGEKIKDENSQQFWCELCQTPCMNKETFILHLNGKKHRKHVCS
ncbi:PREDICTED: zinc finger RNA-binding protein 2-like [Nicotiana attenuata]|uniref:zinc finger RNA-binding protein 2-like n=1 Tax=Nicotiana attenuata TaxID=49451 RepID=UPI000905BC77|nr:PREDICTED: zinc finger RNA-binding protein 2-like [Nicotiana attenuata]